MNPSPLPQPSAQTCPNCGAAVESGVSLCPRCGAALESNQRKSSGCISILAQVTLGCLALVVGAFGACFTLVGVLDNPSSGLDPVVLWGVVALVFAGICIWGIIGINKRNR